MVVHTSILNYIELIAVVLAKIALDCVFNFQTGKSSNGECSNMWNTLEERKG